MGELGELKVGAGWRYRCKSCGFEVGIDKAFPKTCPGPGCHAGGWWGHLVTPGASQNPNNGKVDETDNKNCEVKVPVGIMGHKGILSQLPDAVEHYEAQNKGIYKPSLGRGRGRPPKLVRQDLINQLASQGLSSRQIAGVLSQRGFYVSYRTVLRRQGSLL